jgi:hypothetical protein
MGIGGGRDGAGVRSGNGLHVERVDWLRRLRARVYKFS